MGAFGAQLNSLLVNILLLSLQFSCMSEFERIGEFSYKNLEKSYYFDLVSDYSHSLNLNIIKDISSNLEYSKNIQILKTSCNQVLKDSNQTWLIWLISIGLRSGPYNSLCFEGQKFGIVSYLLEDDLKSLKFHLYESIHVIKTLKQSKILVLFTRIKGFLQTDDFNFSLTPVKKCVEGCFECFSTSECNICMIGYYKLSGNCIKCSSDDPIYKNFPEKKILNNHLNTVRSLASCALCSTGSCYRKLDFQDICSDCSTKFCLVCDANIDSGPLTGYSSEDHICLSEVSYDCFTNCKVCSDSGCTECETGYNLSGGKCACPSCSSCFIGCSTCNAELLACLACNSGYYLSEGYCKTCSSSCGNCFNNCMTCTDSACTTCNSGYGLSSSNCVTCESSCSVCFPNCATCTSSICESCNIGYYLFSNSCNACTTSCSSCFPGCSSCTSTACTSCNFGYHLTSGSCTQCSTICSTCFSSCSTCLNTECSTCISGYFLSAAKNCDQCSSSCSSCYSNCLTCTNDACQTCASGYYLIGINCATCSSSCSSCFQYCSACTDSQCTTCQTGYFVSGGSCTACSISCANCFLHCITCNNLACTLCDSGYFVSNGGCLGCDTSCSNCFNHCSVCTLVACTTCADGYFLLNGACSECSTSCSSCYLECLACSNLQCTSCSTGFFVNSSHRCAACSTSCQSCFTNCITCTNSECSSCASGYFVSAGNCAECSTSCSSCFTNCATCSNSQCSSCNSGYYLDSTVCTNCINSCSSCYIYCELCTQFDCTKCATGFDLNNGRCSACSLSCRSCFNSCMTCTDQACTLCDLGYFLNNGLCSQCSTNCGACFSNCVNCDNIRCTLCSVNYFVNNGVCSECSTSCQSCFNNCLNCNNSQCLLCKSGYFLVNGACSQCSTSCSNCFANCQSCSNTECLVCLDGYYINLGICHQCSSDCSKCFIDECLTCENFKCLSCKDEFYLGSHSWSTRQISCPACNSECKTCSKPLFCDSCKLENKSPINGICKCHNGFFEHQNKTCSKCAPICKTCSSFQFCTSCLDANAILDQNSGNCICPKSLCLDYNNITCKECDNIEISFAKTFTEIYLKFSLPVDLNGLDEFMDNEGIQALGNGSRLQKDSPKDYTLFLGLFYNERLSQNEIAFNCTLLRKKKFLCNDLSRKIDTHNYEYPKPTAKISKNGKNLGRCDSFILFNGSLSDGNLKNRLIFEWYWKTDNNSPPQDINNETIYNLSTRNVYNYLNTHSSKYQIIIFLTVTNIYNETSTATYTEKINKNDDLYVGFESSIEFICKVSQQCQIFVSSAVPCVDNVTSLSFEWSLNLNNYSKILDRTLPSLLVKKNDYDPNEVGYNFTIKVYNQTRGHIATKSLVLKILPDDPKLKLNRSPGSVSRNQDFKLDASGSYNPNIKNGDSSMLNFSWISISNDFNQTQNYLPSDKGQLLILKENLSNIKEIIVSGNDTESGFYKTSNLSFPISLTDDEVPSVLIKEFNTEEFSQRLAKSSPKRFEALINGLRSNSNVFWYGDDNKITFNGNINSTAEIPEISISELVPGKNYKIFIDVSQGKFFHSFSVNQPPIIEDFIITELNEKNVFNYWVKSRDEEEDIPILYEFGYNSDFFNFTFILQQQNIYSSVIPYLGESINATVIAFDSLGDCSSESLPINPAYIPRDPFNLLNQSKHAIVLEHNIPANITNLYISAILVDTFENNLLSVNISFYQIYEKILKFSLDKMKEYLNSSVANEFLIKLTTNVLYIISDYPYFFDLLEEDMEAINEYNDNNNTISNYTENWNFSIVTTETLTNNSIHIIEIIDEILNMHNETGITSQQAKKILDVLGNILIVNRNIAKPNSIQVLISVVETISFMNELIIKKLNETEGFSYESESIVIKIEVLYHEQLDNFSINSTEEEIYSVQFPSNLSKYINESSEHIAVLLGLIRSDNDDVYDIVIFDIFDIDNNENLIVDSDSISFNIQVPTGGNNGTKGEKCHYINQDNLTWEHQGCYLKNLFNNSAICECKANISTKYPSFTYDIPRKTNFKNSKKREINSNIPAFVVLGAFYILSFFFLVWAYNSDNFILQNAKSKTTPCSREQPIAFIENNSEITILHQNDIPQELNGLNQDNPQNPENTTKIRSFCEKYFKLAEIFCSKEIRKLRHRHKKVLKLITKLMFDCFLLSLFFYTQDKDYQVFFINVLIDIFSYNLPSLIISTFVDIFLSTLLKRASVSPNDQITGNNSNDSISLCDKITKLIYCINLILIACMIYFIRNMNEFQGKRFAINFTILIFIEFWITDTLIGIISECIKDIFKKIYERLLRKYCGCCCLGMKHEVDKTPNEV